MVYCPLPTLVLLPLLIRKQRLPPVPALAGVDVPTTRANIPTKAKMPLKKVRFIEVAAEFDRGIDVSGGVRGRARNRPAGRAAQKIATPLMGDGD